MTCICDFRLLGILRFISCQKFDSDACIDPESLVLISRLPILRENKGPPEFRRSNVDVSELGEHDTSNFKQHSLFRSTPSYLLLPCIASLNLLLRTHESTCREVVISILQ